MCTNLDGSMQCTEVIPGFIELLRKGLTHCKECFHPNKQCPLFRGYIISSQSLHDCDRM